MADESTDRRWRHHRHTNESSDSGCDPDDLDGFKEGPAPADDHHVNDGSGLRARMFWRSVTDSGGSPADTERTPTFQFDLGSALARLGDDVPTPTTPPDASTERPATEPAAIGSDGEHVVPPSKRGIVAPDLPSPSGAVPMLDPATPFRAAPGAPSAPPAATAAQPDPVPDEPAAPETAPATSSADPEPEPEPGRPPSSASHVSALESVLSQRMPPSETPPDVNPTPPDVEPPATSESSTPPPIPALDATGAHGTAAHAPSPPPPDVEPVPLPLPSRDRSPEAGAAPVALPMRHASPAPTPSLDVFASDAPAPGPVDVSSPPAPVAPSAPVAPREPVADMPAEPEVRYPRRTPGAHLDARYLADEPSRPAPVVEVETTPRPVFGDVAEGTITSAAAARLPQLPESVAAAPAPMAGSAAFGPTANDINALRSAQARARRQQKQGRLFGRTLLAFIVIGGMVAGALSFGRSLLFPVEWEAELIPLVTEIQTERGVEFTQPVGFSRVPAGTFGERAVAANFGEAWVDQAPVWRALGLAAGDVTTASVGAAMAETVSVLYDPTTRTIYQVEGTRVAVDSIDLRLALEQAFDHQMSTAVDPVGPVATPGFVGVSPPSVIAERAVERLAVAGQLGPATSSIDALPLPLAYELAAIDTLGAPLMRSVGGDVEALRPGSRLPDGLGTALDDAPIEAMSSVLQLGESSLADPAALGDDDWAMVWSTRLAEVTVDELTRLVIADSFRPVDRGGMVCVIAVFQSATRTDADTVFADVARWAVAGPEGAADVNRLDADRVQLEACDPGIEAASTSLPGTVDALLDRQVARLNR